ncbi:hypothetical protein CSUI_000551 [Cystoisospora suis]|uniref:Uncharacterized protein n=1 Tax=Cystoisospora suis TaxID=483139 RepID=A0A2C6LG60_9APIC|nr:hypothetical protein CSUI_000551 [Cystoisospora suis]
MRSSIASHDPRLPPRPALDSIFCLREVQQDASDCSPGSVVLSSDIAAAVAKLPCLESVLCPTAFLKGEPKQLIPACSGFSRELESRVANHNR